jgi:glycopeptide antibiotics resistance protein
MTMFKKSAFASRGVNILILIAAVIYSLIMIKLLLIRFTPFRLEEYRYNLIPFKTIGRFIFERDHYNTDIWVKNLFGNIVLFIPLGVFIPLLNKKYIRAVPFFILVFFIILTVELLQMFTRVGFLDVDDLILNIAGALIGLAFTKLFLRIFEHKKDLNKSKPI